MQMRVLVVDDDCDIVSALQKRLTWMGHEVLTAEDGEQALKLAIEDQPDLMLLDIELPGLSGLDVLKRLTERRSNVPPHVIPEVVVITAFGTIDRAVEAIRLGACDFLTKPFEPDHLSAVIEKARAQMALTRQIGLLQEEVLGRYEHVIGQSPRMIELLDTARRAAGASATVLLLGETGTGKEVMARALHRWSPRAPKPFVVVNCAALPESLLENELFGHEKGAYTGAVKREPGKIESAEGGTVFLDEIGDMPAGLQTRLLRLLQDQEFYRVGGTQPIRTDVRFIAATNKDLKDAIQDGVFREDLFYRLNVITVELPTIAAGKRQDEQAMEAAWLRDYPAIFTGLLTLFAEALEMLPKVEIPEGMQKRMLDYQRLGEAVCMALGGKAGEFSQRLDSMHGDSLARGLESYGVAVGIQILAARPEGREWEGTYLQLLTELNRMPEIDRSNWPRSPRHLSGQVKRIAPGLRRAGVKIEAAGRGRTGAKVRIVRE